MLGTLFELLSFYTRLYGCQLRFCYIYLDGVQVEQVFLYFQLFLRQVIALYQRLNPRHLIFLLGQLRLGIDQLLARAFDHRCLLSSAQGRECGPRHAQVVFEADQAASVFIR